jgi:hypothetical protein
MVLVDRLVREHRPDVRSASTDTDVTLRRYRPRRRHEVGEYNRGMRKALDVGLIVGFLAVDFLFFHDVFKAGETTTVPEYMTGILSIAVIAICARSFLRSLGKTVHIG